MADELKIAGDGTVTRTSALTEERGDGHIMRRINWDSETFLSTDHLGLTKDRAFVDNVLNRLLRTHVMHPHDSRN
jgi:hypothetical protein